MRTRRELTWRVVYGAGEGYCNDVAEIEMVVTASSLDGAMLKMERAIRKQPLLTQRHMHWECKRATVVLTP